jgi:hypothetical protein
VGLFVLDDLVGGLVGPQVQGLAQRLVGFLVGDDDGAQPERIKGGEERAVGVQSVRHHHVDPAEGLFDSPDQPRGRGLLPLVQGRLDQPRGGPLALRAQGTQVLREQGLEIDRQVEPLVDQERHRVAVVVLGHLEQGAVFAFDLDPPRETLQAVPVA